METGASISMTSCNIAASVFGRDEDEEGEEGDEDEKDSQSESSDEY